MYRAPPVNKQLCLSQWSYTSTFGFVTTAQCVLYVSVMCDLLLTKDSGGPPNRGRSLDEWA